MFNVRLAGSHLYGKQLSLVVSFMASFVLSFFPLDVLDGIWDLIESVSEGFLTYSFFIHHRQGSTVFAKKYFLYYHIFFFSVNKVLAYRSSFGLVSAL